MIDRPPGSRAGPRRSERVPLTADARLEHRAEVRLGTTHDVGPGGCRVVVLEPLVRGAIVKVALSGVDLPRPLLVDARVVWARGPVAGIEYSDKARADAEEWFQLLVRRHPKMLKCVGLLPPELPVTSVLSMPAAVPAVGLTPDEESVRGLVGMESLLGSVVWRSSLPAHQLVAALLGLLEKGALTLTRALSPDPVLDPFAGAWPPLASELPGSAAPIEPLPVAEDPLVPDGAFTSFIAAAPETLLREHDARPWSPTPEDLLAEARLMAAKGQLTRAIQLARQALRLAPRDREIAELLAQLMFKSIKR